jgi:hypothetical protein
MGRVIWTHSPSNGAGRLATALGPSIQSDLDGTGRDTKDALTFILVHVFKNRTRKIARKNAGPRSVANRRLPSTPAASTT